MKDQSQTMTNKNLITHSPSLSYSNPFSPLILPQINDTSPSHVARILHS